MDDAVVVHNDIAELLFNFEWSELIDDIQIRVTLPDNSEILRVWSHGPVNGENKIINNKSVMADWDFLNADTTVDVRVAFDKTLVPTATKISNVDNALDKIISFETKPSHS